MVKDVVERFQDQFEREGTKFNFTPSLETAVVDGDQYRLEQVVSNLVTNAMKYGEGKPILIKIETEGDNFHLSVKDEGMGIEKENLSKIFSKFERAIVPNEISGLGLGLYISKQIVDSHRGKIHVESHKGQGSTFTVIIPALRQKPHAPIG